MSDPPPGRGGTVLLVAVGAVGLLLSLALFGAGAAVLWANDTLRGADGYFATAAHSFETDMYALTSDRLELDSGPSGWLFREEERLGTVRLSVTSSDPGDGVFVGIGPEDDVAAYLDDVPRDRVRSIEVDPFSVRYERIPGDEEPAPPVEQGFWAVSAAGRGTQTVSWEVQEGTWSVVVMNVDGSQGVAVEASAGADVPFVPWIAAAVFVAATALLAGAGFLLYLARRG